MKLAKTEQFNKAFNNLEEKTKQKAKKQFNLFLQNLFHPSLHTEKLAPKERNIWSFRVNKKFRVIFTFSNSDTILFLDIGPHDIYKKL